MTRRRQADPEQVPCLPARLLVAHPARLAPGTWRPPCRGWEPWVSQEGTGRLLWGLAGLALLPGALGQHSPAECGLGVCAPHLLSPGRGCHWAPGLRLLCPWGLTTLGKDKTPEMVEEKGVLVERLLSTGDPPPQSLNYSLTVALPRLSNATLCLRGCLGSVSGPVLHPPACPPQLQQTEAELRKMDEAIALFQRML